MGTGTGAAPSTTGDAAGGRVSGVSGAIDIDDAEAQGIAHRFPVALTRRVPTGWTIGSGAVRRRR
jgi:hypothetical protein